MGTMEDRNKYGNHADGLAAALDAGERLGRLDQNRIKTPEGKHYTLVPDGYTLKEMGSDLEAPKRIEAAPVFYDVASFVAYVSKFGTEATILAGDSVRRGITAHIDYHDAGAPSFRKHTAGLVLRESEPFSLWRAHNGKPMTQRRFAEFIEDNVADVVKPSAASLLEVAQTMTATNKTKITAAKRLTDGRIQMEYKENLEAKAGARGDLEIPQTIVIKVAPFLGGKLYPIEARLRYRIPRDAEEVTFSYHLERLEDLLLTSYAEVSNEVAEGLGRPILMGQL